MSRHPTEDLEENNDDKRENITKKINIYSQNISKDKLKVNSEELKRIILHWHKSLNHYSSRKLEQTFNELYDLKGCRKIIESICDACIMCQKNKKSQTRQGTFQGTIECAVPFGHIVIDLCGPYEYEEVGESLVVNLMTIIDICTRWVEIIILDGTSANEVSKQFQIQ